ncbi:Alpha-terpineol synthase, chloroplastic [Linum perenne]
MTMIKRLEMIDDIQRLGLAYHFQTEILKVLETAITSSYDEGLYGCALRFRLLRQAGFMISQDIFNKFRDQDENFKQEISSDVKGLLALYEASHLALIGEDILDDAKIFTVNHLKKTASNNNIIEDQILAQKLHHALELPLHWRSNWAERVWFIGLYHPLTTIPPPLLELAMLDFNMVQQLHAKELDELTRWWKDLGLMGKVEFARDALVESFNWAVSTNPEPKMGSWRVAIAKVATIVHVIDDAYDVYGFLDELELFTTTIKRWDVNELDNLPYYLQLCFLVVYNLGNEMAYANLKQQGFNSLPYIKKSWADLCHSYLEEARCYHCKGDQTLDQYLKVAWKSVACAIVLVHGYLSMPEETLSDETLDHIFEANLTRLTSIIVRLVNDLASSKDELERGDVTKSVECYMKEKGVSEITACDHIDKLICETWKMVNQEIVKWGDASSSSRLLLLPPSFVKMAVNVVRASHYMYKHGNSRG